MGSTSPGKVYFVGAGPGNVGLLTLRALECLRKAHVIVYDRLVNEQVLTFADPQAKRVYAGKAAGNHALSQREISRLLVDEAEKGKTVVRLKGGDPFIFGRGGEEAEEVASREIPFEVVPGVSSASGAPGYAGIPLTHRRLASSVAFVTGHEDPSKGKSRVPLEAIFRHVETLVVLMGVSNLPSIIARLLRSGRSPSTPVAVIQDGTLPQQQTVAGTLEDIVDRCRKKAIRPPAILVAGGVAGLREKLSWFERLPIFGRRIVVTRAFDQVHGLASLLYERGARPYALPTIEVRPPHSYRDLDRKLALAGRYDYILFTSVNGVQHFFERLAALGRDVRSLGNARLGAIGPKTKAALERYFLHVEVMPDEFCSAGLVKALKKKRLKGKKILLPRSRKASSFLPGELRHRGARVDEVTAYDIRKPPAASPEVRRLLLRGDADCVTFTSPSTFANFLSFFTAHELASFMPQLTVAAIGPVTEKAILKAGYPVHIVPEQYTLPSLADAIEGYFSRGTH